MKLDLPGIYQLKNICTFLEAREELVKIGWKLPWKAIENALQEVKKLTGLSGRWEVIHNQPLIVLEVAHNKDGIVQMMQHIGLMEFGNLHLVLGMVKDKDLDSVLPLFPSSANYYFTQAQIPRAVPAQELSVKAAGFGLKGGFFDDVNIALKHAIEQASANDLIVVCGSIFLVAEVERGKLF
jgi:dihydrofolate synthase / folylpolyglutamate synthase